MEKVESLYQHDILELGGSIGQRQYLSSGAVCTATRDHGVQHWPVGTRDT